MPRKIRDALDAHACLDAAKAAGLAPRDWARQNATSTLALSSCGVCISLAAPRDSAPPPSGPRLVELVPAPPSRPQPRYVLHVAGCVVELDDGCFGTVRKAASRREEIAGHN